MLAVTAVPFSFTGVRLAVTGVELPLTGVMLSITAVKLSFTGVRLAVTGIELPRTGVMLSITAVSLSFTGVRLALTGVELPLTGVMLSITAVTLSFKGVRLALTGTSSRSPVGQPAIPGGRFNLTAVASRPRSLPPFPPEGAQRDPPHAGGGRPRRRPKTQLQEVTQALGWDLPEYRLTGAAGPDHSKVFTVECWVGGELAGR